MPPVPPAAPAASVVVCTHTAARWGTLVAAVESALAQRLGGDAAHEVVVVVDHNPALLVHARRRLAAARVVASTGPAGLSGARNTGVEVARGEVVAFLDDDAVAAPGWLAAHVAAFDDPAVVGTGGVIDPCWEVAPPRWWPREFDWVVGCTYEGWAGAEHATIRNPIGANMAFRRAAMVAVGGFSPDLGRVAGTPAGCEETELAIRMGRSLPGAKIAAVPGAKVRHRVPPERTTFGYFARRCLAEGRSKALVARTAGAGVATAAERAYVLRTLPAAVCRSLRQRRPSRAGAVLAGLACTTAGFAAATVGR